MLVVSGTPDTRIGQNRAESVRSGGQNGVEWGKMRAPDQDATSGTKTSESKSRWLATTVYTTSKYSHAEGDNGSTYTAWRPEPGTRGRKGRTVHVHSPSGMSMSPNERFWVLKDEAM